MPSHTWLSSATTVEHSTRQPWVDMSMTRACALAGPVAHRRGQVQRGPVRAPAFGLAFVLFSHGVITPGFIVGQEE